MDRCSLCGLFVGKITNLTCNRSDDIEWSANNVDVGEAEIVQGICVSFDFAQAAHAAIDADEKIGPKH
jgi:hypothetical protein